MKKKYSNNLCLGTLKSNNEKVLVYERINFKSFINFDELPFYYQDLVTDDKYIVSDFTSIDRVNYMNKLDVQDFIIKYINEKITHTENYKKLVRKIYKR